jgi:hypothetical protein
MGTGVETDAILVSFDACGASRVLLVGGLDADAFLGVLPPLVLATLAASS